MVFGQIIVWKVVPDDSLPNSLQHHDPNYRAVHICKLVGHEGSIFRLSWSSNGSKLVSVSDDRRWIGYLIFYMISLVPLYNLWFLFVFLDICVCVYLIRVISALVQCSRLGGLFWNRSLWWTKRNCWPRPFWSQCPRLGLLYFRFCELSLYSILLVFSPLF